MCAFCMCRIFKIFEFCAKCVTILENLIHFRLMKAQAASYLQFAFILTKKYIFRKYESWVITFHHHLH